MINIKSSDKSIKVEVNDGVGANWQFDHDLNHKSEAIIISNHFKKELRSWLKEIRKEAYEAGYKDGRHKQKKISEFSEFTESKPVGWK